MSQNIQVFNLRPGGTSSLLDITAAQVVFARPGCLVRILVQAPGTAGALTLNDNTQTGGSNVAANQIMSWAFGSMVAGQVIELNWPCLNGLVVSAVPSAGSPVFAISYF